jgi:hypothetical protein
MKENFITTNQRNYTLLSQLAKPKPQETPQKPDSTTATSQILNTKYSEIYPN